MLALPLLSGCSPRAHDIHKGSTQASTQDGSLLGVGNADIGRDLTDRVGCGACHQIRGLPDATGRVGPPLTFLSRRAYIAGVLPNNPDALVQWIMSPQSVKPGDAMPDLGLSRTQASDIAAYLYTLQ